MMKRLVVDTPNLLWRVAAAQNKYGDQGSAEDKAGLAMHVALNTLKSHYRKVKPSQVALAFEGKANWRKEYTKSEACISKRLYKGNRVKDDSMIPFFELIASFEELARNHTSMVCLSNDRLEGDDLISAYAERFSSEGDEVVVLSGDKDFIQLLKLPNVSLLNPDDGKLRGFDKNGDPIDPEYFMFEKALRGDAGDNVLSAYPRVRATKILKAFENEYDRANLMNQTWVFDELSTGEQRTMVVGQLFEENQLLMNLFKQPADIRELMRQTVDEAVRSHGTFSLFHFQRFVGRYKLKQIGDNATQFIELFSSTGLNSPFKAEAKTKRASTLVF